MAQGSQDAQGLVDNARKLVESSATDYGKLDSALKALGGEAALAQIPALKAYVDGLEGTQQALSEEATALQTLLDTAAAGGAAQDRVLGDLIDTQRERVQTLYNELLVSREMFREAEALIRKGMSGAELQRILQERELWLRRTYGIGMKQADGVLRDLTETKFGKEKEKQGKKRDGSPEKPAKPPAGKPVTLQRGNVDAVLAAAAQLLARR